MNQGIYRAKGVKLLVLLICSALMTLGLAAQPAVADSQSPTPSASSTAIAKLGVLGPLVLVKGNTGTTVTNLKVGKPTGAVGPLAYTAGNSQAAASDVLLIPVGGNMAGLSGTPGPAGARGYPGPAGPAGSQGVQGIQGLQGLQGLNGLSGSDGANGAPGAPGSAGPQGAKGDTGTVGGVDQGVGCTNPGSLVTELALSTDGKNLQASCGSLSIAYGLNTIITPSRLRSASLGIATVTEDLNRLPDDAAVVGADGSITCNTGFMLGAMRIEDLQVKVECKPDSLKALVRDVNCKGLINKNDDGSTIGCITKASLLNTEQQSCAIANEYVDSIQLVDGVLRIHCALPTGGTSSGEDGDDDSEVSKCAVIEDVSADVTRDPASNPEPSPSVAPSPATDSVNGDGGVGDGCASGVGPGNGVGNLKAVNGKDGKDGMNAYELAVDRGFFKGTLDEWLVAITGGAKQSENGPQGLQGLTGKSAFEVWIEDGHPKGTKQEFFASLKGEKGDTGAAGLNGKDGVNGLSAYDLWATGANKNKSMQDFLAEFHGVKGDTGAAGAQGPAGPQGLAGLNGKSAFELWAVGPNKDKTMSEFFASLKGDKGDTGATGAQGPKGDTGAQGPQGLKGDTGATGPAGPAGTTGYTATAVCLSGTGAMTIGACKKPADGTTYTMLMKVGTP